MMGSTRWVAGLALVALAACAETPTETLAPEAAEAARWSKAAESPTVVDVAIAVNQDTGEFSTLIAAVVGTGLADALSAKGQRTVFAPTDAAFAALGLDADNVVDALGEETLRGILLYHVANGRRDSGEVLGSDQIRMLNGGFNEISLMGGLPYIGAAQIIQPDVEATNGIIHVIDAVLLPGG